MKTIYPNIKQAILLCLMLIIFQLFTGIIVGLLQSISSLEFFLKNHIIKELLKEIPIVIPTVVVVIYCFKRAELSFHEVFRLNSFQKELILPIIITIFGLGIISSEIDNVIRYFLPPPNFINEIYSDLFTGSITTFITVTLIVPICEETLFRRLILNSFLDRYSVRKSILVTAGLFMIVHLNPYQFPSAFLGGVFLAYLFYISRNLWLCVFAHALNNFFPFFFGKVLGLDIPGFVNPNFDPVHGEFQPLWLNTIGAVVLTVGIYFFIDMARNDVDVISES